MVKATGNTQSLHLNSIFKNLIWRIKESVWGNPKGNTESEECECNCAHVYMQAWRSMCDNSLGISKSDFHPKTMICSRRLQEDKILRCTYAPNHVVPNEVASRTQSCHVDVARPCCANHIEVTSLTQYIDCVDSAHHVDHELCRSLAST